MNPSLKQVEEFFNEEEKVQLPKVSLSVDPIIYQEEKDI